MLYGKWDSPPMKRAVPAQTIAVCPAPLDNPRDPWWLIPPHPAPYRSPGQIRGDLRQQVLVQCHVLSARRSCLRYVDFVHLGVPSYVAHAGRG